MRTLDPRIIDAATEAWVRAWRRIATRKSTGVGTGYKLRGPSATAIIESVAPRVGDSRFGDHALWRAYETEVVRLGTERVTRRNGRAKRKPGTWTPLSDAERAEILRRLGDGEAPKAVAKAVGRSLPIVYQLRSGAR